MIVGLFNGGVVALRCVTMTAKYSELAPYDFRITADVAGVGQAGDRTQGKLLAATGDHHRRARLLDRFGSRMASSA
jgi:hypothetical protein